MVYTPAQQARSRGQIPYGELAGNNYPSKKDHDCIISVDVLKENKTHVLLRTVLFPDATMEPLLLDPPHIFIMTKRAFNLKYDRRRDSVILNHGRKLRQETVLKYCPDAHVFYQHIDGTRFYRD